MKTTVLALAFAAALTSQANAAATSTLFDVATGVDKVTVPAKGTTPAATTTCHYYPQFMVKEIDEGEVGAAQISILPTDGKSKPKCERTNVPGEKVINPA